MTNPGAVAANLTEIVELHYRLQEQAIHKSRHREMPGGDAMVALAHVANLEAWENQYETAERTHAAADHVNDEDELNEPPLQILCYWSERWRREHGHDWGTRATILTESNFIRWALDWATVHEPEWERFADDIRRARARLEDILLDGRRDIVSDDVSCLICETLLRRRMTVHGYEEEWFCIECYQYLTPAQFNLAASAAARRSLGLN
jgi:hypothetical protein